MKYIITIILIIQYHSVLFGKDSSRKKNSHLQQKNKAEQILSNEDEIQEKIYYRISSNIQQTKISQAPLVPQSEGKFDAASEEDKSTIVKSYIESIQNIEIKPNKSSITEISNLLLKHKYPEVRAEAARALGRIGSGLKALHKAIENDTYEVKKEAYHSIVRIGSKSSIPYFLKGIHSSDPNIQSNSFIGLGKTHYKKGRELIYTFGLTAESKNVISSALVGLGYYSKREDLELFYKYLQSDITDIKIGAIAGLGNSNQIDSALILLAAYKSNPELTPEIIIALAKKEHISRTYALIKLIHFIKNENYQNLIRKELLKRGAFGDYAIVKNSLASIRKFPRPNSHKVTILKEGEIAKIKDVTTQFFKARMNNEIIEDKYYLLQAINPEKGAKKSTLEGWVFGPKITIISLTNPNIKNHSKVDQPQKEDDSEDERILPGQKASNYSLEQKKNTINEKPFKDAKNDTNSIEEDEDE